MESPNINSDVRILTLTPMVAIETKKERKNVVMG